MDVSSLHSASAPIIGGNSSSPSFNYKKCKRIILIGASILAGTAGVAAAVIFFAVPSVALSPAIAITAMIAGVLGLGVLLNAGYRCYKAHKRLKDLSKTILPTPTIPPIPPSTPLQEFGPEAFMLKKFDLPKRIPMSSKALQVVLNSYQDNFKGTSATVRRPVRDLLIAAYNRGQLQGSAEETFKKGRKKIQARMRIIFDWLVVSPGSEPTTRQNEIALKLGTAFEACQVVQYDAIEKAADEVLTMIGDSSGGEGTIVQAIFAAWQNYKMKILDTVILKRHPNCNLPGQKISEQFVHIKSAYIAHFGDSLGFSGVVEARLDRYRPTNLLNSFSFSKDFKEALDLEDFANSIVVDINNPKQKECLFQKESFGKFVRGRAGLPPDGFCYYTEDKSYTIQILEKGNSKNIEMKPDGDQEYLMKPFVTIEEIRILLRYFQIGIAG